jgi:hypothetical protein
MNASQFLAEIVGPNCGALSDSPGDVRLAVNAILTADAFFGIYFAEQQQNDFKVSCRGDDDKYRDAVAGKSPCYAVLRDTALAIMHGQLSKGTKTRVVRNRKQIDRCDTHWSDDARWDDSAVWVDEAVIIETESGTRVRVDKLINEILLVAGEELTPTGRNPAKLEDISSILS